MPGLEKELVKSAMVQVLQLLFEFKTGSFSPAKNMPE